MANVLQLKCRECSRTTEAGPVHVCDFCFGPLEPVYDYDEIRAAVSRSSIAAGPHSIWRYADLLPVSGETERVDLGAGFTPLVRAHRLGAELGIDDLWLKNDTVNPTFSFKDRVVSVALSKAREFGLSVASCASTGNLAHAVAAHAAKSGMASCVFFPADLEQGKIVSTAIYGGHTVAVKGNYDDVNRLCAEIADAYPWAFVNVNIRAFYSEGSKTLAFEVCEQLGWSYPDHVVIPIASGALLEKFRKGLRELNTVGLMSGEPATAIHGAQALGCSPVAEAFKAERDHIRPVKPDTIAKSLAIGNPASGPYALAAARETGGQIDTVTDDEIVESILLLARTEGIFTETAGGVTVGVLRKLAQRGAFAKGSRVVALITGMGLKTLEAVTSRAQPTATIPPTLDEFEHQVALGLLPTAKGVEGGVAP
jgi:threonine synthase